MSIRILIIEDEPAVASVIRKALAEEGYDASVAMMEPLPGSLSTVSNTSF
jgi:DNA-binding response OmpR family regulator